MKLFLLVASAPILWGQAKFEVASVKPGDPRTLPFARRMNVVGDRFVANSVTLSRMILQAFGYLQPVQITIPTWTANVLVYVEAKVPGSKSIALDSKESYEMLQSLLQERYGMQFHTEQRLSTVYVMSVVDAKLLDRAKVGDINNNPWPEVPSDFETNPASLLKGVRLDVLGSQLSQYLKGPIEVSDKLRDMGPYNLWVGSDDPVGYLKQREGILLTKTSKIVTQIIVVQLSKTPTKD